MGRPSSLTVEIEFTSGAWTDVTSYVQLSQSVSIRRGRNTVLDTAQIGSCAFALIGDDGRFTPGFNGSPYFPNVRPNVRVRVTVSGNVRFVGYVDKWEPTYPDGGSNRVIVNVTATDQLRLLARKKLNSTFEEQVQFWDAYNFAGNVSTWPCSDAGGTRLMDSAGRRDPAVLLTPKGSPGSVEYAQEGPPYGPPGVKVTSELLPSSSLNRSGRMVRLPNKAGSTSWTVGWWVKPENLDLGIAGYDQYFAGNGYGDVTTGTDKYDYAVTWAGGYGWRLQHDSQGVNIGSAISGFPQPAVDEWLFIAVVHNISAGTLALYVNGQQACSQATSTSTPSPYRWKLGGLWTESGWTGTGYAVANQTLYSPGGTIAGAMFSEVAWTSAYLYDVYAAGTTGYAGESAGDRAVHLAYLATDTYPGISADTDAFQVGPLDTLGQDVVTLGQELATSANGLFYVNAAGNLVYHNSNQRRATLTPAATFANEADTAGSDFSMPIEEARIANTVTVNTKNDGSYTAIDAASITAIGTLSISQDLNVYSSMEAMYRATYYLAAFTNPQPRLSSVSVDLMTSATAGIYATTHAIDLDSRIRVTGLPTFGPATQVDAYVEGITEEYSITSARITFDCSPADLPAATMVADNGGAYSSAYDDLARLDCDGSQVLASACTSSATSLSASCPGVQFTTTDVPFSIELDGERMTVTAVAAGSGTNQTLTVTRGVDGTNAVAHASGTAIYLAHDLALGL